MVDECFRYSVVVSVDRIRERLSALKKINTSPLTNELLVYVRERRFSPNSKISKLWT